jgi:hypothetical protein
MSERYRTFLIFVEGFADGFWGGLRLLIPFAILLVGVVVCIAWLLRWLT